MPTGLESIRVPLIDQPGQNLNLDFTLADTTETVAELRAGGHEVFVHCAEAHSRTTAVGALYAARHRGVPIGQAWEQTASVLPHFDRSAEHREAVERIAAAGRPSPAKSPARRPLSRRKAVERLPECLSSRQF